jgi:hypothetical protein
LGYAARMLGPQQGLSSLVLEDYKHLSIHRGRQANEPSDQIGKDLTDGAHVLVSMDVAGPNLGEVADGGWVSVSYAR